MNRQRRTRSEPAGAAQVFADAAVDSSPRGEFAYKSLIQAIRTGALRPGGRIREEEVARMLGISRTPVLGTEPPVPRTAASRIAHPERAWHTNWRNDRRYDWHDWRRRHRVAPSSARPR